MHNTVKNLLEIENRIKAYLNEINIANYPNIIAVYKTFKIDKIFPLIKIEGFQVDEGLLGCMRLQ